MNKRNLKFGLYLIKSINRSLIKTRNLVFKFALPNLFKKINYLGYPDCVQKLKVTGNGKIFLGKNNVFGCKLGGGYYKGVVELQPRFKHSKIVIGDNVAVNNNLFICAANYIEIGDDVLIGNNVTIMDFEAHGIEPHKRRGNNLIIGEVKIGRNVWIGNNVNILLNTTIGENCIVALGSIVKGNFPANVIIGGAPAKVIKEI